MPSFGLFKRKTEYSKESTPTSKYTPFQTFLIDCDKNAVPWTAKGQELLKAKQQSGLKGGFRGIEADGKYRIIYFLGTTIEEAQNSFRENRNTLETFFGIKTPEEPKEKEEYWSKIIAGLERA